jgi:5-methylcytosine-specific restriction endonuclease McrA
MDEQLKNFEYRMQLMADAELLQQVGNLFAREKKIGDAILLGLKEIKMRKLHLAYGYSSLFEMLVKYFHLSETASYQRINSLKLIDQVPEAQEAIFSGEISLTNAALVQSFFQKTDKEQETKISSESKIEILNSIKGKTIKEVQKQLASINPVAVLPAQKETPITATHTQLQIVVDEETLSLLKELQQKYSHIFPDGNYSDIIKYAAKKILSKDKFLDCSKLLNSSVLIDSSAFPSSAVPDCSASRDSSALPDSTTLPDSTALQARSEFLNKSASKNNSTLPDNSAKKSRSGVLKKRIAMNKVTTPTTDQKSRIIQGLSNPSKSTTKTKKHLRRSRYVAAAVRRKVFHRAQYQCEYVGQDHHRCESRHQLEIDHIISFSHGGHNKESNLQLLCKNHNLYKMNFTHRNLARKTLTRKKIPIK